MIEVNLLPKDYLKGSRGFSISKAGKYVFIGIGAMVLLLASITFYQSQELAQLEENINKAQRRADALRNDIRMVDALIEVKEKIAQRMTAVDRLDQHRSVWVRVLEDVGRNVPEFVWLNNLSEVESKEPASDGASDTTIVQTNPNIRPLNIEGFSFTLNALAAYMIKMMRSDYFDKVELVSAEEVAFDENYRVVRGNTDDVQGQKAYNFVVSCNLHYLSEEELRNLIATINAESSDNSHRKLN